MRTFIGGALCAMLLAGCGSDGHSTAQAAADATTKAVIADDYSGVTANFDSTLKQQISRTEVAVLSDKLQALGSYTGISYVDGDAVKEEYTYRLSFQKGNASVVVRLDPSGSLAAYRLFPQT